MDRNQKAKQDFAVAAARRQFQQAVTQGQTGVLDRFGALIGEGDLVLWIPPAHGLVYQVKSVVPVLNPGAPVGLMKIELICTVPVTYPAGQRGNDIIKIGKQSDDQQHTEIVSPEMQPDPPSPLVLTDGDPIPARDVDPVSQCDKCGSLEAVTSAGTICLECGTGTYRLVTPETLG